ncbi:MAG: DUF3833 family protein [Gammaproteobacteria bacterium]
MNLVSRLRFASRRGPSLAVLLPPLLVTGRGGLHLDEYADRTPAFDPFDFFPGRTRAWGIVQDWRGRVARSFKVDILGSVAEDVLTLNEAFDYADGEKAQRTWHITRTSDGQLTGRADDIVGDARGAHAGNTMRWRYDMVIAAGGRQHQIAFDDWMWLLDDDVLVNRSYLRKLGIKVGEVTLFMRKQDD